MKVETNDDGKGKHQSFTASYYNGDIQLTIEAYGADEDEAMKNFGKELDEVINTLLQLREDMSK